MADTNIQFYTDTRTVFKTSDNTSKVAIGSADGTTQGFEIAYDLLTTQKEFKISKNGVNYTSGITNDTTSLPRLALTGTLLQSLEVPPNPTTLEVNKTLLLTDNISTGSIGIVGTTTQVDASGDLVLNPVGSISANGKTLDMTNGEIHKCPLIHGPNNTDMYVEAKGTGDLILETNGINRLTIADTGIMTFQGGMSYNNTTNTLTATNFTGTASKGLIADENSGSIYYPVFTAGIGSQSLLVDSSTGPFQIIPSTGEIKMATTLKLEGSGGNQRIYIGRDAGRVPKPDAPFGTNCIGIGLQAGEVNQQGNAISIGNAAGNNSQEGGAIAIGVSSGTGTQRSNAVAIGNTAGSSNQGIASVAIGQNAGQINQGGSSVAIGIQSAINNQGGGAIAIGANAARGATGDALTYQKLNAVAIGNEAGRFGQGDSAVAIGNLAGQGTSGTSTTYQGNNAISIGKEAGKNSQGVNSIAIGIQAGLIAQLESSVAIGENAGRTNQNIGSVAIGRNSGYNGQGAGSIAIGSYAGGGLTTTQGTGAIAIGDTAGRGTGASGQGNYAISIGKGVGATTCSANSIALIATGVDFAPPQPAFYVDPIRNITTKQNQVQYNTSSKEISYVAQVVSPETTNGFDITGTPGGLFSTTAGAASGSFLRIRINNIDYKINLLNNA